MTEWWQHARQWLAGNSTGEQWQAVAACALTSWPRLMRNLRLHAYKYHQRNKYLQTRSGVVRLGWHLLQMPTRHSTPAWSTCHALLLLHQHGCVQGLCLWLKTRHSPSAALQPRRSSPVHMAAAAVTPAGAVALAAGTHADLPPHPCTFRKLLLLSRLSTPPFCPAARCRYLLPPLHPTGLNCHPMVNHHQCCRCCCGRLLLLLQPPRQLLLLRRQRLAIARLPLPLLLLLPVRLLLLLLLVVKPLPLLLLAVLLPVLQLGVISLAVLPPLCFALPPGQQPAPAPPTTPPPAMTVQPRRQGPGAALQHTSMNDVYSVAGVQAHDWCRKDDTAQVVIYINHKPAELVSTSTGGQDTSAAPRKAMLSNLLRCLMLAQATPGFRLAAQPPMTPPHPAQPGLTWHDAPPASSASTGQ
jgi:hypothetical protein